MRVNIIPGKLKGAVQVPPSKSYAHRMLICAALGNGVSELTGIAPSEDMLATMDCIRALGASCEFEEGVVTIEGIGRHVEKAKKADCKATGPNEDLEKEEDLPEAQTPRMFPCRESGSTLRFFIPIALVVCGGGIFTGTKRLMERGIGIYEEIFRDAGISVEPWVDPEMKKQGMAGIRICGTLGPGDYKIRGDVSSQFVTGLLFALSLLERSSTLEVLPPVESRAYIDITLDTMWQFGVTVHEIEEDLYHIPGGQTYQERTLVVESDWSNAAFLYAFNAVGHDLQIHGLNHESMQGDKACVAFLEQLAGKKEQEPKEQFECAKPLHPARSQEKTKMVGSKEQSLYRPGSIDISNTPDLGPALFAAAAALCGGSFTGTHRLRIKESDRAAAMKAELEKFGITCHVGENEVVVERGVLKKPEVPLNGHNDHRIVMALSVLASLTGAQIEGAQAVSKSWPDFFEALEAAGLRICNELT